MDTMEHATRKKVRQHPAALRQQVLMECAQPGASVARVAQSHGLNANMVHAWRLQERAASAAQSASTPAPAPQFIAMPLPPPAAGPLPDIRIELRRGATSVSLTWPLAGAEHCALWMRELLK